MGNLLGKRRHQGHPALPASSSSSSSSSNDKITDHDRAVLDLKVARDKLSRHRKRTEAEAEKLADRAKILVGEGKKDKALLMLKIKKFKVQALDRADAQLLQIVQLIDSVEWEKAQLQVFEALKEGKNALEAMNAQMPIEDVEALMEESQEAIAYQDEISNLLAGAFTSRDEEDLDAEYEALAAAEGLGGALKAHEKETSVYDGKVLKELQDLELPEAPSTEVTTSSTPMTVEAAPIPA